MEHVANSVNKRKMASVYQGPALTISFFAFAGLINKAGLTLGQGICLMWSRQGAIPVRFSDEMFPDKAKKFFGLSGVY
jgi:hypothetical protein